MPARKIRKPGPDFDAADLPIVRLHGLDLLRVHSKDYPAIGFRTVAAHRFSHPDAPGGLLYLGESVETCLLECFGTELLDHQTRLSLARWSHSRLSRVSSKAVFRICDLADEKVRLALGVDLSALMHTDLEVSQAWGLAIQKHPTNVDGLRYLSRFDAKPAVVLFDRPGLVAKLSEAPGGLLPDVPEADSFLLQYSISLV
jgi:hypothetical protein